MKRAIICFCAVLVQAAFAGSPSKPNILFILADDLGINDLHCYGRQEHHTPNLDRLASQGVRFTSGYCAQPICSPSRVSILTGKTPARLHLTTYLPGRPDCPAQKVLHPEIQMQVPLSEKMLPNYFKDAGYICAAIGKWHVGGRGFGPLEHGFDFYHEGKANTRPSETEGGKGEYDLTATAERFIETNRNRPFLVYLAHNSPHIPFTAQQRRIENNRGAFEPVYAGVIESLDDTVGRLLAKLEALGLQEQTIVVFTSDNGGLHVPEGPHPRVTHNSPYRAGKGFVYEGGLRIPLIVRWPGHVPAGRVVQDPVINTDWVPTLLDLAGQPVPQRLDGTSFAPLLTGQAAVPPRKFFWHFPHYTNQGSRPSGAVRDGNWILVEYYDTPTAELYDLSRDIAQAQDLASREAERVKEMQAALAEWRRSVNAQENRPNPEFDSAKYRELYIDVDASRFNPARAATNEWNTMQQWRRKMNQAVRAADTKPQAKWRSLPLIADGHIAEGWVHVGWGGFVVDGDALRTECDPKGLGLLVYEKERFGNCQIRVVFRSREARSNSGVFVRIADGIMDQVSRPGVTFDRDSNGKISKSSMQGMMASADREEGPWFAVHRGYEVQIMDENEKLHRTGSIYSLARSDSISNKAAGVWKTMIITLSGNRIFVDLEGQRVTSFDPDRPDVPRERQWFEPKREPKRPENGYIGLQNHDPGDVVWFKEVSMRPL